MNLTPCNFCVAVIKATLKANCCVSDRFGNFNNFLDLTVTRFFGGFGNSNTPNFYFPTSKSKR